MIVEELYGRGKGERSAFRSYLVTGTDSPTAAETAALAAAPLTSGGYLFRQVTRVREVPHNPGVVVGAFEVTVTWSTGENEEPPAEEGTAEYSFEVRPASQLIKVSRETVGYFPTEAATPQFGGAVNVDTDMSVQGVQWPMEGWAPISKADYFDPALITNNYVRQLYGLAGKVCSTDYDSFDAGELMFMGARGRRRGYEFWFIEYMFGFFENATGLTVGGISVPSKKGWHLLWPYFEIEEHSDGSNPVALVPKPRALYVERIAEEASFAGLDPS